MQYSPSLQLPAYRHPYASFAAASVYVTPSRQHTSADAPFNSTANPNNTARNMNLVRQLELRNCTHRVHPHQMVEADGASAPLSDEDKARQVAKQERIMKVSHTTTIQPQLY
jgi:hypothetical protein